MKFANTHISYCTNIHSGESWAAHFAQLKSHVVNIKNRIAENESFGLGLRISAEASKELEKPEVLKEFQQWLDQNDIYVFTLNGFPYGDFHEKRVKDLVHFPDWTTEKRRDYTISLFKILSNLIEENTEAGISTSPLSYRFWFEEGAEEWGQMRRKSTQHIIEIADFLQNIESTTGKYMHLDIEPEPDGVLENLDEFLDWYQHELIPQAIDFFNQKYSFNSAKVRLLINRYITICYDVCHFALAYEDHAKAMMKLESFEIKIGKFQISSALKILLDNDTNNRFKKSEILKEFDEPIYLHQVIAKDNNNVLHKYRDLSDALPSILDMNHVEWRSHFHVPIFLEEYTEVSSTQKDIIEVLNLQKLKNRTNHIEVETYTWNVLPKSLQIPIHESIIRELQWLINKLKTD